MHSHGPDCLDGPWSRAAGWWFAADCLPDSSSVPQHKDAQTSRPDNRPDGDQPFRADLVERVRWEIAQGRYDTPEKWQAALERLLDQLSGL
jgi:hypothetical protein